MAPIVVRLDRVQILSWAPLGRKPPLLDGFKLVRDSFVRRQTSTGTYARCRQYQSTTNDAKIYWQYARLKGWLKPWKITLVGDDECGLSYEEVARVLKHCRDYAFLTVEVAIDFAPSTGVKRQFIRQHAAFGKSRRRG
jgi:hypothetical protein